MLFTIHVFQIDSKDENDKISRLFEKTPETKGKNDVVNQLSHLGNLKYAYKIYPNHRKS